MAQSAVSFTDESLVGAPITLTNCDREPIHIPGLIQPYGFLLCLDEASQRIVQASANAAHFTGLAPAALLGQGLDALLGPARLAEVEALWPTLGTAPKLLGVRLERVADLPFFKLILHRYDGLLWAEFEPVEEDEVSTLNLPALNTTLGQMLAATTVREFCEHAVAEVRTITGFARVAMYRFAADESGEVVAEAKRADLDSLLGLHYPATDIPQQARAMYLKNWLRFIPDIDYAPTRLVPGRTPAGRPPDMTYAVLRSVSPIHIEYLRNMGVAATMTISIIQDSQLWGMIMCHHDSPRLVSFELRELCLFIGKTFSALLPTKEKLETSAYQLRIQQTQARLLEQVSHQPNLVEGLYQHQPTLREVLDCGGAAICLAGEVIALGTTPSVPQIRELVQWLQARAETDDIFHTDSLASHYPAGLALRATASGVLAVALAREAGEYLLWFRPELLHTVTWAGKHEKVQKMEDGQLFLSPRQSFEAWKQTVENTAAPWLSVELAAAQEIRQHIADVRLKLFNELQARAASLTRLNTELTRSNDELDSFAYVASHDLKEPLRGIHNYSIFLLEDYAAQLDEEGVSKLQTLVRLSKRMEALIDSLLQMARIGRLDLEIEETDLNELVAEVLDLLQPRFEQTGITVAVRGPLPTFGVDRTRLGEVFNNLLTNAIKYSDKPDKLVTIGLAPAGKAGARGAQHPDDFYVFYVQDNGIGIDPKHSENIFRLFKRLHAQDKYGGGTGAGLAIAKKMVEKHGGELWVESVVGQGATFYFSLPKSF